ncbi:MAG: hypothetical protein LBF81_02520, partial [Prevotellaceae bacterium]|nr:hypothetical protein [Prevotellaceae bacterium]
SYFFYYFLLKANTVPIMFLCTSWHILSSFRCQPGAGQDSQPLLPFTLYPSPKNWVQRRTAGKEIGNFYYLRVV